MTDKSFDQLMQQYEMGLAYKAITAHMGPSPQLVAFVNYENVTEDNVGLESFDIMSDHQTILNQIENDNSFELAIETLEGTINKIAHRVKEGGWAGVLSAFSASFFLSSYRGIGKAIPYLGGVSVAAIIAGNIVLAVTKSDESNEKLYWTFNSFADISEKFNEAIELDTKMIAAIPSSFNENDWKKYRDFVLGGSQFKRFFLGDDTLLLKAHPTVDRVSASGWTKENYVTAVKWLDTALKEIHDLQKKFLGRLEPVQKWLEDASKDSKESKEVMNCINKTIGLSGRGFQHSLQLVSTAEQILNDVGHLFKEKK